MTALQTGYQFTGSIPYYVVGTLVVSSIILELGPVLTALILAGRIGARYAAELGTMRVTEQIDALESLGRSPASHLVIPRVLAGLVMIPALTVLMGRLRADGAEIRRTARYLTRLGIDGVELIDSAPRKGAEGPVAFLHPRSCHGVLVELIEKPGGPAWESLGY